MILTTLSQYYDRLAAQVNPDTGTSRVPAFGYSDEKIGYILVLSADGNLVDVVNHHDTSGKKPIAKQIAVPRPEKRTSGVQPNFLWDKPAYVLGVQANTDKNTKEEQPWTTSENTFEAFKRFHIQVLGESNDKGLSALVKFLQQWRPELINSPPCTLEIINANLAFQLDGDRCYLHDRDASRELWTKLLDQAAESSVSNCLVTGKREKIARLHPSIKGVYGGQSSGGSIVSFNADSYESYGKTQGENAPVSEVAAFKYTTALNYLLNRDNKHCISVGDASTVFWAVAADQDKAQKVEQLFMQVVSPSDDSEAAQLKPLVEQIAQGRPMREVAPDIDPQTRFYLLGLAPNASRISVRYWLDTSFGQLQQRIGEHYQDLSLDPLPWHSPPSIWRLLIELVPHRADQKPKSEDIPSHLAGELMRSILTGDRYPYSLLAQIVTRIRSDGHVSPLRVALVKAVLQRNRKYSITEEIPMSLDENNDNQAYLLGRLFAVLEKIQKTALEKRGSATEEGKKINSTIVDRYFGSASTVPYSVFPRLLTGSKHHLAKIRKDQVQSKKAYYLDEDIEKIVNMLPAEFPKHLSIEDQGRFTIGYYQQRSNRPLVTEESEISIDDDNNIETN